MAEDRAKTFLQMIRRSQRGRLKVYLGYGPGVGKTCLMLEEAHRLKKQGVDVVVGIVETHGREGTSRLIGDLEVLPRRGTDYRGIKLEEFDVDATLGRRPEVVLVDELAHTNVPGSRNMKRYEDVQELLAAGIHVITTLNVQHLESLYNTVERMVGVKVRERLPDSVLAEADQVVNVDLSPEDLQKRLAEGKVYPRERIAPALENFFTETNLEQLRELTMREIASQIDFKRRETPEAGEKLAPDQIMVCLSSRGESSARLLRFASRLAGRLNRNWYAVYVQTPSEDPTVIDATTQRLLADTLTLANQLGATVFTFKGSDVVDTILRFAREYRVSNIVIGRSRPLPAWKRWLGRPSTCAELVERAANFTVIVVDAETQPPTEGEARSDQTGEHGPDHGGRAAGGTAPSRHLSEALSEQRIRIFEWPMAKEDVLRTLVGCIAAERRDLAVAGALDQIHEREAQGSTFLNEGIALPHARLDGLTKPEIALAVTRGGISDVPTDHPIEVVFLLLTPTENAREHLQILGAAARVFRNASLRRRLAAATQPTEVRRLIADAEGE